LNKVVFALESLKNMQDLIKFSDQKAAAILVVSGVLFTAFFRFSNEMTILLNRNFTLEYFIVIGLLLVMGISLFSVFYIVGFRVLKPRLAKSYNGDLSLYYFEHLSFMGKEKIKEKYSWLNEEQMLIHLIEQQYELAMILEKKMSNLDMSFRLLFVSILSFILLVTFVRWF